MSALSRLFYQRSGNRSDVLGEGEIMAKQGCALSSEEIRRIVFLLSETEMTVPQIAQRMQCSPSAVLSINRRFTVRFYGGLRKTWLRVASQTRELAN